MLAATTQEPTQIGKVVSVQPPRHPDTPGIAGRVMPEGKVVVILEAATQEPTHLGKLVSVQFPVHADNWNVGRVPLNFPPSTRAVELRVAMQAPEHTGKLVVLQPPVQPES